MKYYELILQGTNILINSEIEEKTAKNDAEELFLSAFRLTKTEFLKKYNEDIDINCAENNIYNDYIQQRANGKPLAYITHNAVFFGYNFFVNESTLIPRVDSEIVIENAISFFLTDKFINEKLKNEETIKILDACCGSGCLGLSFVKKIIEQQTITARQDIKIELTMLDISSSAIQVAKINAQKLLPDETHINIKYIISDIVINGFGHEKYDIILHNPPYIETSTIKHLNKSVKNFEPHLALDGGEDGLKFYKSIAHTLSNNFFQNSIAFFEIGFNQGEKTKKIFTDNGFNVKVKKDYGHQDRCLIIKK